jgi:uncharacterized protein YhaN
VKVFQVRKLQFVWADEKLGTGMIKERFQELSNQLNALRKRSDASRDSRERRTLLQQMRQVLKEIDDLVMHQTEWNQFPSNGGQS